MNSDRPTAAGLPSWRLIVDAEADGAWNMGIDEALLASAAAGGRPTLRLYRWGGPWLSLGYSQTLSAERETACTAAGVGVVERATGGRAVLHGGDLTYAIGCAESDLPAGLSESYELVSRGLRRSLERVGVVADPAPPAPPSPVAPLSRSTPPGFEFDCFASAAGHEICVGGRKLVGSAQRRVGNGVLQHGSIRLFPDPPEAVRACGFVSGASTSLAELGITTEAIVQACIAGFAEVLCCEFERDEPTPEERTHASGRTVRRASIRRTFRRTPRAATLGIARASSC